MQDQIRHRTNRLTIPCNSLDATLPQEYQKGEIAGINFIINFPDTLIEEFEQKVEDIKNDDTDTD